MDRVRMPAQGAPQPPDLGIGMVGKRTSRASAAIPYLSQGVFQQGQVPRFCAYVFQHGIYQPRFGAALYQAQTVLDGLTHLIRRHARQVIEVGLETTAELSMIQARGVKIGTQ